MPESDAPEPSLGGRALLIEDNAIVALDTEDMLRSIGFELVDVTASVSQALKCLSLHVYDAAILDLMVRDGSTTPLADELAKRGTAFVIASGYSEGPRSPATDAAPRVSKPYDEATLRGALIEAHARAERNR